MFARALVGSVFSFKYVIQIYFLPYAKQMRTFAFYHEPTALLAPSLCLVLWVEFAGVVDTSRTLKSYVIAGTWRLQSCWAKPIGPTLLGHGFYPMSKFWIQILSLILLACYIMKQVPLEKGTTSRIQQSSLDLNFLITSDQLLRCWVREVLRKKIAVTHEKDIWWDIYTYAFNMIWHKFVRIDIFDHILFICIFSLSWIRRSSSHFIFIFNYTSIYFHFGDSQFCRSLGHEVGDKVDELRAEVQDFFEAHVVSDRLWSWFSLRLNKKGCAPCFRYSR